MKKLLFLFLFISSLANGQCVTAFNLSVTPSTYNMQMQDSTLLVFRFDGSGATIMRFIPLNFIPQMETSNGTGGSSVQPIADWMFTFGSAGNTGFYMDAMSLSCQNLEWQVRTYCYDYTIYQGYTWQDLEAAGVPFTDTPIQHYTVACPAFTQTVVAINHNGRIFYKKKK